MPIWLGILLPIVFGFAIGYGTNRVAIAMLFRPYHPIRLPFFTLHGIFPRLQGKFAAHAGELIEREFFHADAIRQHVGSIGDRPEAQQAIREILERALATPIGSGDALLKRWVGEPSAVRAEIVAAAVRSMQRYLFDDPTLLREVIAPQMDAVLRRPLRRTLLDLAAVHPSETEDAGAPLEGGDPSESQEEADEIGRLLGVPQLLRWLADSEVPRTFAGRAIRLALDRLREVDRVGALIGDTARDRIADWICEATPTIQRLVAAELTDGDLREIVQVEARKGVKEAVEARIKRDSLLGRVITPDRVLAISDGAIDRLPGGLASLLKSDGATRTIRTLMRDATQRLLDDRPERLIDALDEAARGDTIDWLTDRLAAGIRRPDVIGEVDRSVRDSLQVWLDRPTGEWLASIWFGADLPDDDPTAAASRDIVDHLIGQIDTNLLATEAGEWLEERLTSWLQQPIGTAEDLLVRLLPEKDREAVLNRIAGEVGSATLTAVDENLDAILPSLDVSRLVRENLESWDPRKLEEAVHEVSRDHLGAITWFGGALGAIVGLSQAILWLVT